jgi:rRNA-processing protein EBP2
MGRRKADVGKKGKKAGKRAQKEQIEELSPSSSDAEASVSPYSSEAEPEAPEGVPAGFDRDLLAVSVALPQNFDADDDIAREQAFHDAALTGAIEARRGCLALGIPFARPADYYAEMLKDDAHMQKLRSQLLFDQKKIQAVDRRRKEQEQRKFGAKVQRSVEMEKATGKKRDLEAMTAYRKQRERSASDNQALGDVDEAALLAKASTAEGKDGGPPHKRAKKAKFEPNKRRQAKNRKYGGSSFGEKPKAGRSNDASSAADFSGFNAGKNRSVSGKTKNLPRGSQGGGSRPGKNRRRQRG